MRNRTATSFWQKAAQSLPPQIRARYASDFAAAERWEARLEDLIEFFSQSQRLLRRPRNPSASSSSG
jgi:hypothetical protein